MTSRTIRDRFSALLYAEAGPTAAGLLEAAATRRTEAFDALLLKSDTGLRRRKLAFRAYAEVGRRSRLARLPTVRATRREASARRDRGGRTFRPDRE